MPVVFSYKLQYFKAGAFAYGDFLSKFPISILEISAIPAKQRKQTFLTHMLCEGPSNIQCYIVQKKKILEEK